MDYWSWTMMMLSSLLMIFISFLEKKMSLAYFMGYMIVSLFFCSNKWMVFYILFECSLVPLFISVMSSGAQPERYKAAMYMMLYTLVMSFPLFLSVIYLNMLDYFLSNSMELDWILFVGLMGFLVKIPIFFLHLWLPRAHVEASLSGSMFLAGILLKMGVFGFYRMSSIIPYFSIDFVLQFLFCLSMCGFLWSGVVALSSDDMKMSVALSSVSHMNFCLSVFLSTKSLSMESALIIMVSHGLSSPMLFYCVTVSYIYSNSRSFLVNKGLLSKFPHINGWIFWFWVMNICIPPSIGFIGELWGIMSISYYYYLGLFFIFGYLMINSIFSFVSYGMMSQSSYKENSKNFMNMTPFMSMSKISSFFLISMFMYLSII